MDVLNCVSQGLETCKRHAVDTQLDPGVAIVNTGPDPSITEPGKKLLAGVQQSVRHAFQRLGKTAAERRPRPVTAPTVNEGEPNRHPLRQKASILYHIEGIHWGTTIWRRKTTESRFIMAGKKNLEAYQSRRDFEKSPEPSGANGNDDQSPRFVIQKHDASSLHYDFRLQVGDVLKSWAVPKGPSTDPRDKRLATPTDDHPLEYMDFEGVIPEGEYGAGTVLVWDTGPYRNLHDAEDDDERFSMQESLDDGKVEVWLDGEKLSGGYALVRMSGRDDWLLIKMDDEEADARRNPVSTEPASVLSGRTLEEIREQEADEGDGGQ